MNAVSFKYIVRIFYILVKYEMNLKFKELLYVNFFYVEFVTLLFSKICFKVRTWEKFKKYKPPSRYKLYTDVSILIDKFLKDFIYFIFHQFRSGIGQYRRYAAKILHTSFAFSIKNYLFFFIFKHIL